ncbi:MAG: hypothetical protein WCJ45_02225 [bacterium]
MTNDNNNRAILGGRKEINGEQGQGNRDKGPVTGDKEPGNREPGAGSRELITGPY